MLTEDKATKLLTKDKIIQRPDEKLLNEDKIFQELNRKKFTTMKNYNSNSLMGIKIEIKTTK